MGIKCGYKLVGRREPDSDCGLQIDLRPPLVMAQNPIFSRLRRAEKKGFYLRMLQNPIFFAPAARYKGVNRKKHWPAAGGNFWGF